MPGSRQLKAGHDGVRHNALFHWLLLSQALRTNCGESKPIGLVESIVCLAHPSSAGLAFAMWAV